MSLQEIVKTLIIRGNLEMYVDETGIYCDTPFRVMKTADRLTFSDKRLSAGDGPALKYMSIGWNIVIGTETASNDERIIHLDTPFPLTVKCRGRVLRIGEEDFRETFEAARRKKSEEPVFPAKIGLAKIDVGERARVFLADNATLKRVEFRVHNDASLYWEANKSMSSVTAETSELCRFHAVPRKNRGAIHHCVLKAKNSSVLDVGLVPVASYLDITATENACVKCRSVQDYTMVTKNAHASARIMDTPLIIEKTNREERIEV